MQYVQYYHCPVKTMYLQIWSFKIQDKLKENLQNLPTSVQKILKLNTSL